MEAWKIAWCSGSWPPPCCQACWLVLVGEHLVIRPRPKEWCPSGPAICRGNPHGSSSNHQPWLVTRELLRGLSSSQRWRSNPWTWHHSTYARVLCAEEESLTLFSSSRRPVWLLSQIVPMSLPNWSICVLWMWRRVLTMSNEVPLLGVIQENGAFNKRSSVLYTSEAGVLFPLQAQNELLSHIL